jgi:hypothetical protein
MPAALGWRRALVRLSEKPDFMAQLMGLAAIKPGAKLTKESYEIWWRAMQSWSLDDFKAAAAQLALSMEFMPSPFHFEKLRKAGRPTASESWAKVLAAVRATAYGRGGVVVSDLVDRAVAGIGGYRAIGMSETDKTHFLEKRFNEAFESLQDAEDTRAAVPEIAYSGTGSRLQGPARASSVLARIGQTVEEQ